MKALELTANEVRVLGALVEKDRTTPDSYPLSTNALVAACNQKTSRDPVLSLSAADVDAAMLELRQRELARTVKGAGERSYKHRHVFQAALNLDDEQVSLLAVLMLRGPQTPGELRTRTERYVSFAGTEEVERALGHLASRPEPLVRNLGRGPGQSQDRWIHLLADVDADAPDAEGPAAERAVEPAVAPTEEPRQSGLASAPPTATSLGPAATSAAAAPAGEVAQLRAEVVELRQLVEQLYDQLGVDLPDDESE